MKDAIYTVAASLCGIGFYFTIIGVFALPAACLSLVLFSTLVVGARIFQPDCPTRRLRSRRRRLVAVSERRGDSGPNGGRYRTQLGWQ